MDLEAGLLSVHVSEDNCLQCHQIDPTNTRGRLCWCKVLKSYIRTNLLCTIGWKMISEKMIRNEIVEKEGATEEEWNQSLGELVKEVPKK